MFRSLVAECINPKVTLILSHRVERYVIFNWIKWLETLKEGSFCCNRECCSHMNQFNPIKLVLFWNPRPLWIGLLHLMLQAVLKTSCCMFYLVCTAPNFNMYLGWRETPLLFYATFYLKSTKCFTRFASGLIEIKNVYNLVCYSF